MIRTNLQWRTLGAYMGFIGRYGAPLGAIAGLLQRHTRLVALLITELEADRWPSDSNRLSTLRRVAPGTTATKLLAYTKYTHTDVFNEVTLLGQGNAAHSRMTEKVRNHVEKTLNDNAKRFNNAWRAYLKRA